MLSRKKYSELDGKFGERGELELRSWLRGHGYQYTVKPNGQMGVDGEAENDSERFIVEVERRTGWKSGEFPWKDKGVDVPERRAKMKESRALFFVLRMDIRAGLIVFPDSLRRDRMKAKKTTVTPMEGFFIVPYEEVLPIDLTVLTGDSIARMNANRVRMAVEGRWSNAQAIRGEEPPYGLDLEEWRYLGDKLEEPLIEQVLCQHHRRRMVPDWHNRPGWVTWECLDCPRPVGHNPLPGKQAPEK